MLQNHFEWNNLWNIFMIKSCVVFVYLIDAIGLPYAQDVTCIFHTILYQDCAITR